MARRYKRDSRGRFAATGGKAPTSGSISAATRTTTSGSRARMNARTTRAEQVGRTGNARYQAQSARATMRGRADIIASGGSGARSGAKMLGEVATRSQQRGNQSRQKAKTMERERRSLLRRGSMRGGR